MGNETQVKRATLAAAYSQGASQPRADCPVRVLLVAISGTPEHRFLLDTLRLAGHEVAEAGGSAQVEAAFASIPHPQLVIAQAEAVRGGSVVADFVLGLRATTDVPLILVARQGDEDEELLALHAGADVYLARRLTAARLRAYVAAQLRREPPEVLERALVLVRGDAHIDVRSRRVSVAGRPVDLTRTEFDLLYFLMVADGAAVERERLMDLVWGPGEPADHVLDVHVSRLRRKLRDLGSPIVVETLRGFGFRVA